jgi:hypothetical protein
MKSASRTLVKSPPELWELIDQPDRMQGLMCGLLGRATEVTVDERKPESVLRWHAAGDGDQAWIEVELAEKGWGTRVEVSAESPSEPTKLEGWLDAVLEELATPQKRPFESMGKSPAPETSAASAPVAAPVGAPAEAPAAQTPPAEDTQAEGPKKRRRLFGLL